MSSSDGNEDTFQRLKACCVPLLGLSTLTPGSISKVSALLSQLIDTLRTTASQRPLTVSLINYVFFPVSSILRNNAPAAIPDQVLEKIFALLALLCERWWWEMDVRTWEQVFMFAGAILAGFDTKGKGKERADETREAAVQCLWALARPRTPDEDPLGTDALFVRSDKTFAKFQTHAQTPAFVPTVGQTVNSLLGCTESPHMPLQRASLSLLHLIIKDYLPDGLIPSVLPGVVSSMCKVALGTKLHKTWANGDIVASALSVIQEVVIRAVGDDVCVRDGAVRGVQDLEDLVEIESEVNTRSTDRPKPGRYATARTPEWLRGTSSQLHIALNSLNLLVKHPSTAALQGLSSFAAAVLGATSLTLPQSQPLLLTILLSLSASSLDAVSSHATGALAELLGSDTQSALLPVLLQISRDYLASLPRLLPSRSDTKVEHVAQVIEAVCRVATTQADQGRGGSVIANGVSKLLGPNGGVEKWGWSLLSVLELSTPPVSTSASAARLMLENETGAVDWVPFPPVNLALLASQSAQTALQRMFRALGSAAGDASLYAVEWFFDVGRGSASARATAALWCGCRLLEGVGHVTLDAPANGGTLPSGKSRRLIEKFSRGLAKQLAELWDVEAEMAAETRDEARDDDDGVSVEHLSGLVTVRSPFELVQGSQRPSPKRPAAQPHLQKALALQAIAISSGVLQSRFTPLLLDTLYPILHSLVSKSSHLSSTALSALHFITHVTSHASPSNLLLSNFDYALDAVSRHLNRRWLDVDAAAVLVILVRLVGRDVVTKAGDVVDECFDRLDEYHGYESIVDGLIAVLSEVVDVVGSDSINHLQRETQPDPTAVRPKSDPVGSVLAWLEQRGKPQSEDEDKTDFGPVPQKAWGEPRQDEGEEEGDGQAPDPTDEKPVTPTQALIQQIVSRSMYFLTHGSPTIRARILTLLSRAVPVLPERALLPSVHHAWPFVLNRFADPEPFVLSAAATFVETLAENVGDFMYQRVWDDIWPRFRTMLAKLDAADEHSALARRGRGAVGTESAYTHSHRLYRAIIKTMAATARGVQTHDNAAWEVIVTFRRFLHKHAHEELQACARDLYKALSRNNGDAVWLALTATMERVDSCAFLYEGKWDIVGNANLIIDDVV